MESRREAPYSQDAWLRRLGGRGPEVGEAASQNPSILPDPSLVEEAARVIAELHIKLLWAVAVFFQSENTVPPFLSQTLSSWMTRSPSEAWNNDYGNDFVPILFANAYASLPELQNPYWVTLVVSSFADPTLRSAIFVYEDDIQRYIQTSASSTEHDYEQWLARVLASADRP